MWAEPPVNINWADTLPTVTKLADSTESNDAIKQEPSFENLQNNYEKNEWIRQILESFSSYIDLKLEWNFTDTEKDSIRLTLLNDVFNTFDVNSSVQSVLNGFLKPLGSILTDWKVKTDLWDAIEDSSSKLTEMTTKFSTTMTSLWLQSKVEEIDAKIAKINTDKKSNPSIDLSEPQKIQWLLDSKNVTNISKEAMMISLKWKLDLLSWKINKSKEVAGEILNVVNNAPFWSDVVDWVKDFAKDSPLLWFFLKLIFWKDFLDEWPNKMRKSTEHFKKFVNSKDFPLIENIKEEDVKTLESKELSKFYKFLDNRKIPDWEKKINYTSDTFWGELLTWKTQNKQINDLHILLKWEDWEILDSNEWIKEFVVKLNWLEVKDKDFNRNTLNNREELLKKKLAEIKERKPAPNSTTASSSETTLNNTTNTTPAATASVATISAVKQATTVESEVNTWTTNTISITDEVQSTEPTVDKAPQINTNTESTEESEIIKELQEIAFKKSVEDITSLPTKIEYGWDQIDINIEGNEIILDWKKYNIDLLYTWEKNFKVKPWDDLFERVTFNDWELKIVSRLGWWLMKLSEKSETISRWQLVEVLENLMMKSEYKKSLENIDINITKIVD